MKEGIEKGRYGCHQRLGDNMEEALEELKEVRQKLNWAINIIKDVDKKLEVIAKGSKDENIK